ncbi:MAG TPA: maltose alpha-D-glucosyltransferase [Thermoanaerobaculia bacterium]|nr:maltose alpha-D-glucosyltransferase [Thermoanaerobaculia bacterium]
MTDDPLWYKDAVIYQIHVRAFADANGDGMGDFAGLTAKLDYLQELGVTALWLLPFYPSPWRDDGYDIADYTSVHPAYGTLKDFRGFLREAKRRGLRVITELVINHTSDQHPWFQRARRAEPGSAAREFYVWSDTPERYQEARIIFKDFEASNWSWDPVARAYFWHRFYSHQPDLNFANERVHKAVLQALDFWMELGVDGLRLDAIPYLYEREGTNCENLPETHAFLKKLRAHVDARFPGRMLLAEANQWPEDAIAYFGDGDECHMAFHFPVMPRLYMAVRMEDRFPVLDILEQTPPIPEPCQWAVFLRNHDELTLEMVTDEDRDYMYRVYAQDPRARINLGIRRRLAPLLGNDRRRIELMNGLLFSLPGSPVVYYGDEIGMGDNFYLGDRNGVRTPMQWSADRNAGFSRANPQRLFLPVIIDPEYHFEAVNVEAQHGNTHSLLWWMRRLVALRKRYRAFSRGTLEFLHPANHHVLAFVRRHEEQRILVVANLSRFAQHAELDLAAFAGATPVELFGRNRFPEIGARPYALTLGPHNFYWFALEQVPERYELPGRGEAAPDAEVPALAVAGSWTELLDGARGAFEAVLPELLRGRRWFGGKARTVRGVEVLDAVPVGGEEDGTEARIALLHVDYAEGEPETYALPLALERRRRPQPEAVLARIESRAGESGVLVEAVWDRGFAARLLAAMTRRRKLRGRATEVAVWTSAAFRERAEGPPPAPAHLGTEQSNSSIRYGDRWMLKLFRRLEPGVNPDLEVGRFLTERTGFRHTPAIAGSFQVRHEQGEPMTLGVLHAFVDNEGDAWSYSLDHLRRFYERALAREGEPPAESGRVHLADGAAAELSADAYETMGTYLASARLLGQRTAEMHLALASAMDDPAFAPEPFTGLYQRSIYQSMRSLAGRTFQLLKQRADRLPEPERQEALALLGAREEVLARFQALLERKVAAVRIRTHGDYHLGQVLYTGKDFVVIDFEGEPARPLSERRLKRSPLRDAAGMLRSFHYAAVAALFQEAEAGLVPPGRRTALEGWSEAWVRWASAAFLQCYLETAAGAPFLPPSRDELKMLLDAFVLEKAIYELAYELNNRPGWVAIPLHGIRRLLEAE